MNWWSGARQWALGIKVKTNHFLETADLETTSRQSKEWACVYNLVFRLEGRVRPQRDLNSFEPEAITINLGRIRAAFYQQLCHLGAEVGRQGRVWSR